MEKKGILCSILLLLFFSLSFGQPVLLKELSSNTSNFVTSNGKLYYTAGDSLFKSDGTAAGTVFVKKIGESSITLYGLTVGSNFFFTSTESSGKRALWKSDGTAANTVKLAAYNSVTPLLVYNGELYLSINNGTQGTELWKTSGAVPLIVKDINPGVGDGFYGELIVSSNQLFFKANSGSGGVNLWKSNGTSAGTVFAADFPFDNYTTLTDVNGTIFFERNYSGKAELWKTNGTTASTTLVIRYATNEEPYNEEATEYIGEMFSLNGKLYFHYNRNYSSVPYDYLNESDGTTAGTIILYTITVDGFVDFFTKALNKLVYQGDSQSFPGAMTVFNPVTNSRDVIRSYDNADVTEYAEAGNLFFFADHINAMYGSPESYANTFQLWQSDLTAANTIPVKSLFTGTSFPGTDNITPAGNKIFFTTQLTYGTDAMKKKRLWYYDPTLPVTPVPYFTVVNATTDEVIQVLAMGDEVEIPTGASINIRYNEVTKPGSVVFKLGDTIRRIESTAPYLLAGDNNGDYSPWTEVKEGVYRLTAIPYSQSGGNGTAGKSLFVEFSVKFQNIPPIVDLGPDRTIQLPKDTVIITAKVTDTDSDSFLYFWDYEGGSTVSQPPVLVENGNKLYVSNLKEGYYDFRVFVSDQEGGSAFDIIRITVTKAPEGGLKVMLVNATTDLDIRELLQANETIQYNPATDNISIRAIPGQAVGSVQFFLNGSLSRNENVAPYALKGDNNGDITPWNPPAGNYVLLIKAFSGSGGSGTLIASKTVNLTVIIGTNPQPQISFTLVNAVTNQDIGPLVNGQVINLSNLPTNKLNVRANSSLPNTKSIIFGFNGNNNYRTENTAPYSLFGDSNGDYADWTAVVGSHTLKGTPFTGLSGTGTAGIPLEITFTIVGSGSAFKTASLKTYPNPSDEKLSIDLENFESDNASIVIYDEQGSVYYEGNYKVLNGAGNYEIALDGLNMAPGIYFVKIRALDSNDEKVVKIIKR